MRYPNLCITLHYVNLCNEKPLNNRLSNVLNGLLPQKRYLISSAHSQHAVSTTLTRQQNTVPLLKQYIASCYGLMANFVMNAPYNSPDGHGSNLLLDGMENTPG